MIHIIRGATSKPVSADRLSTFFANHDDYSGFLFIGYPLISTVDGPFAIDALYVSRDHGVIIFNLVEGTRIDDYVTRQDDSFNKLEAKLRNQKPLMRGRHLTVPVFSVTFAPALGAATPPYDEQYPVLDEGTLGQWLAQLSWPDSSSYESLLATLQSISTIRRGRKRREIANNDTRGAKLQRLEDSIANLDNLQGQAVIETVDGVQRIRGLAGSGKTIVLALKAAYLHALHPDWRIGVTFHTRSLKGHFRTLINNFMIEQAGEEPDWSKLQVLHAWGSPGGGDNAGIYFNYCQLNDAPYFDLNSARNRFGRGNEFDGACETALQLAKDHHSSYDVLLIDEAQDFPPSFLQLCYDFLTSDKRLVYAYDELQNLNTRSVPGPEDLFGKRADGSPQVRFLPSQPGQPEQDIILKKCYRNSRPVLVTAHALGFGIYREPESASSTGLVQIFDRKQLWLDVGYEVAAGELEDGHYVELVRTNATSPSFLETHSPIDDLIQFYQFHTWEEQAEWLAESIKVNLRNDDLLPDDIIVINPDPITTKEAFGQFYKDFLAGVEIEAQRKQNVMFDFF